MVILAPPGSILPRLVMVAKPVPDVLVRDIMTGWEGLRFRFALTIARQTRTIELDKVYTECYIGYQILKSAIPG